MFRGTSAAAPNAAAVASLLRAAFPSASPAQILAAMKQGTTPLSGVIPNGAYGYGRVDAIGALNALPVPSISTAGMISFIAGSGTGAQTLLSIGGTGALATTVTSDNTSLIPSTNVSLDPASCTGANTACVATVNAQAGKSGVAHLTFVLNDGAQRMASASLAVTVSKPTPPVVTVTGEATQDLQMGAVVTPATVVATGTGALTMAVSSNNATLLPSSNVALSGNPCGTSGQSCLVNMTPVTGMSGTAVVTVTATDAYGQSAQNNVTLTIDAPPAACKGSGGGGTLDPAFLVGLGSILFMSPRRRAQTEYRRRTN